MAISLQTQAVLLLTASLGRADRNGARPLTIAQWARLNEWLESFGFDPGSLVSEGPGKILSEWSDQKISLERVDSLLGRSAALGFAIEKWKRAGLWILTRSDPDYPARLGERLGRSAPPILFGCGPRSLLGRGGLAVVGSRDASEEDLKFSRELGEAASIQGHSILSGGARGVDRHAMRGALDNEGTSVGVLADGILRAATDSLYRRPLLSGQLALVSAVSPEGSFAVHSLMVRNRYIYCLADAAVVVASAHGRGGTWSGATENTTKGWVPLWAKQTNEPGSGNEHLVANGARWLAPSALESISELFEQIDDMKEPPQNGVSEQTAVPQVDKSLVHGDIEFYDLFLARLKELVPTEPLSTADFSCQFQIAKGQIEVWIRRGVDERRIERSTGPVRYRAAQHEKQRPLAEQADSCQVSPELQTSQLTIPRNLEFYDLFLAKMKQHTAEDPLSSSEVARRLGIAKGQVDNWIGRGVKQGAIRRTSRPVLYQASA